MKRYDLTSYDVGRSRPSFDLEESDDGDYVLYDDVRPPAWPAPAHVSRSDVIFRLCKLLGEVWSHFDPLGDQANDCFCREARSIGDGICTHWQHAGQSLAWVETVVRAELAKLGPESERRKGAS